MSFKPGDKIFFVREIGDWTTCTACGEDTYKITSHFITEAEVSEVMTTTVERIGSESSVDIRLDIRYDAEDSGDLTYQEIDAKDAFYTKEEADKEIANRK